MESPDLAFMQRMILYRHDFAQDSDILRAGARDFGPFSGKRTAAPSIDFFALNLLRLWPGQISRPNGQIVMASSPSRL